MGIASSCRLRKGHRWVERRGRRASGAAADGGQRQAGKHAHQQCAPDRAFTGLCMQGDAAWRGRARAEQDVHGASAFQPQQRVQARRNCQQLQVGDRLQGCACHLRGPLRGEIGDENPAAEGLTIAPQKDSFPQAWD